MIRPLRGFLSLVLACFFSSFGLTQDTATAGKHKKLGLVLEGGGALGLAHIGVIQWLEEHRIPVSYIAGTSMGGLVGGVYATGRNASEVRALVKGINWDQVVSGQTAFDDLSFRRKLDAHDYPSTLEFGLRNGVQFPSGFNSGQQVQLILDDVSLPYSEVKSFDELPIPFGCVATDLTTNSKHVFRSGPMNLALRSTMSLPGLFSPVRDGDHIYVDGGLLDNLPVDVAKEMGADFVLGIYLKTAPLKPDAELSSFAVLGQSIYTVVAANETRSLEDADLIVTVPLLKYTAMDYNQDTAIIAAGYAAAEANAAKLMSLSVDEATWNLYLAERNARRKQATTPQFVTVTGVPPQMAKSIADEMSGVAGKPVDTASLNQDIMHLTGLGALSSLNYSMVERNGTEGMEVQAATKPYSPPIVRPLVLIDGSDYNQVFFSMGARITFLDFGGYRRELRNDVIVGSQYGINSEYYRPLSASSNWFVAPRVGLNSAEYPLYQTDTLLALYRNRAVLGGLDLGHIFGRGGELRLGYEGGYQHLSPQVGAKELPTLSGATGDVRLQYTLVTLDNPIIPRSGETIRFYTKYFNTNPGAPQAFTASELQLQNFFRVSDPSTVFVNAYGGTSLGKNTGIPMFPLGGVTRFAAYGNDSLLTNQYFLFQAGYIRELKKINPLLGSTINFFAMVEGGKAYQLPLGPELPNIPGDVVGAIVVQTLFGPVELGGAFGNYGHSKVFFQVGRIF